MSGAMHGRQRHLLGRGGRRDVDAVIDHDQVVEDALFVTVEALDDLLLERAQSCVRIKLCVEIVEQLECRSWSEGAVGDGVGGAQLVLDGEVEA
jgi:hypothetical protein